MKAATIGTFDGVHRGHIAVIDCLKREAAHRGLQPVVITFDRHPLETIAPEHAPKRLMTPSEEVEALQRLGLEVISVKFDRETMSLTAQEWMRQLRDTYDVSLLVKGYDNTFGSDGRGMPIEQYRAIADAEGVTLVEAPVVDGISSSAVRKALTDGRFAEAIEMLGHPYTLKGIVTHGDEIGRKIGYPTANILVAERHLVPANGVYAAYAIISDGSRYPAVVNIGVRPTVTGSGELRIEAHLDGFNGNLYNSELAIEMVAKLRDEQRFVDLPSLRAAIASDLTAARHLL